MSHNKYSSPGAHSRPMQTSEISTLSPASNTVLSSGTKDNEFETMAQEMLATSGQIQRKPNKIDSLREELIKWLIDCNTHGWY